MGLGPKINPKTREGAANLAAMEAAISIGRPFTMSEVEQHRYEIGCMWDKELLTIVSSNPLRYEVTLYGHQLVERGRKQLAKLQEEETLAA